MSCSRQTEPEQIVSSEPEPEPESESQLPKATFPPKETVLVTETVSELKSESEQKPELSEILYAALSQYQETVCLDIPVDPDELEQAVNQIERTHPEIFWLYGYSMQYNSQSAEISFQIINQYSPDQLRQMSDELERTVQEFLRTIDPTLSDLEKIRKIHDDLIRSTEYDPISAQSSGKDIANSAYGCLVNHKAICQGYAMALQLLLNRLDIECGTCSGVARSQPHAWNYVLLNQKYYWIDVTWDDPIRDSGDASNFPEDWISHSYFLLDDTTLYRTRTFDEDNLFIPVCDSLEENEFVKSGDYLESYNFAEINQRFTAHASDGRFEVMFRTEEAYQACLQDLFTESHIWDIDVFQSGGNIHYQQDSDLYIIRFWY
ncbi:MAG: hypothetical protein K2O42_06810 [Oscillospiraceae bacterium]|nr:hypothetical protein [Oscillospiraceae bacterium]